MHQNLRLVSDMKSSPTDATLYMKKVGKFIYLIDTLELIFP